MRKIIFIIFLIPSYAFAQFSDDFTDGNFANNPVWSGDTAKFEINSSKQLHLNTTGADTSILCTANTSIDNTEWHFWVKLSFATSANNNARVYLVSDQQNIAGPLNGYFVQIGEANDSIGLFRQTGTVSQKIIQGTIAYTNNSTNTLRIKVTRDISGNWNLYSDPAGGNIFRLEGSGFDNSFTNTSWFGVFCKFTSSNSAKFYFDDFYVGPVIVDTVPPFIHSVCLTSPSKLDILFSENVDSATAVNSTNYFVDNNVGSPITATVDLSNNSLVHLTFASAFAEKLNYTISISNVQDLSNNTMVPDSRQFVLYFPTANDIVINELMVDPDPTVGLPDYEYAELYNRSPYKIDLLKWSMVIGTSQKIFPSVSVEPGGYLIVCSQTASTSLSDFGPTVCFSSFSLVNTGQTIILSDSLGRIIHTVTYSDAWYQDASKANGGWSLEQIDPSNPCGGSENWRASTGIFGGTPGTINSIHDSNPDHSIPQIKQLSLIGNDSIKLLFSEPMDSVFLQNSKNYFIDHNIGYPASAKPVAPDYRSVLLNFSPAVQQEIIYTITIIDTLRDCAGNKMEVNSSARFAIPQVPLANDIVINEILSNPKNDGVDYIEMYNRSEKIIDLKDLVLSSYDTIAAAFADVNEISTDGYLMFPGDYLVLTTDPDVVKKQYYSPNPNGFVKMLSMPSFNNDDGIVVIALKNLSSVIDKLIYSEKMFSSLLLSTDGVSLERISFERPSEDKTNWHAAAETVGFGTPAYKNSQYSEGIITDDPVNISPEIFSPDNDGNNDVLNINYKFDLAGYMGNITIYDAAGRLVRNLVRNELLGTSGTFSWDGITSENEKARIGIYIIYFEVFDLNGNEKHYKKPAVLGGKI